MIVRVLFLTREYLIYIFTPWYGWEKGKAIVYFKSKFLNVSNCSSYLKNFNQVNKEAKIA